MDQAKLSTAFRRDSKSFVLRSFASLYSLGFVWLVGCCLLVLTVKATARVQNGWLS